jgi:flagellar basal-body rod protein FlgB
MFETLDLTRMAQSLAAHAGARLGVIAQNVANADTPGYKARDLPDFGETYAATSGQQMRATRAGHFGQTSGDAPQDAVFSGGSASPNGNSVSLELEMVKSVEARQSHDMALAIYRATSDVIRASLGKGR